MIFKTINTDATKLTEQFGLLDKSFRDIKKDFANGLGLKNSLFQTSISDSDYKALQKFNIAINATNDGMTKSQRITQAWNDNMTGCSIAAKRMGNDLVTGKKKISDISSEMKNATASTEALGVAMNIFANVGIMLAIAAITKVITELAQAQEKAIQAAKEATETYKEETDSIDDYKEKLSELLEELNSDNISYEEAKTKRKELMSIQDELIEKFGTEEEAIKSITDAINGQADALDYLTEKSYRDWVAKADEVTFWNGLLPWGKSGLDKAIEFMETPKTVSFYDMQNANLSDELQEIQKEIDETIQAKYNLDKSFATFKVTGTPEEIKSQLELIRQDYLDLSKDAFLKNGISSEMWEEYRKEAIESINDVINKFDEGLSEHQKTYQTYIEGMIKYDSEYSDEYADILQKRAELESAEYSGNEEEIKKARQDFMDAINKGIEESGSNENIKKYFESLYPELQAQFADWNFEFAIDANTDDLDDTIKEIGEKYTATDLLNLIDDDSAIIADSTFNSLIDKAIEYGICTDKSSEEVQKLINLLVELGYVQDNVQGSTLINETPVLSVSEIVDQFNTQLKPAFDSLKSAYQDIFTDDEFTPENVDISMLDSIRSAIDKLNSMEGVDINIDYSSFDELARVLTDSSSTADDVHNAIDSLATDIVGGLNPAISQCSGENYQLVQSMLESVGIINAEEVMVASLGYTYEEYIAAKENAAQADRDLVSMTDQQIAEFALEQIEANNCSEALAMLAFQKELCNLQEMNTAQEVANLKTLAENSGTTAEVIAYLTELEEIYQKVASGVLGTNNQEVAMAKVRAAELNKLIAESAGRIEYKPNIDYGGANKNAKKAGSSAGKSYKDAFQEEVDKLKSVLSGIIGLIDKDIDKLGDQKNAAVDALSSEKEAALDALEAEKSARLAVVEAQKKQLEQQIKLIDEQIKQKEKVIKGIQEEIDAMKDANDERKRQVTLQEKLYQLERMQNQRTILQYSEDKGMHYVQDTSEIRKAKDEADDAKLEIEISQKEKQISLIEKEIDLLEERKDSINEQIDLLDEQIDQINEYYDELISNTEKMYDQMIKETESYWDSLIKGMEDYKSRWEELQEVEDQAKLIAQLKELGLTTEDITNMSAEAFENFKDRYLAALLKVNEGNADVQNSISELGGSVGSIQPVADAIDEVSDNMDSLSGSSSTACKSVSDTATNLDTAATNAKTLSDNLSNASTALSEEQTSFGNLKQSIDEVIQALNDKITAIQEEQNAVNIATSREIDDFLLLRDKIIEVKESVDEINTTVSDLDSNTFDNLTNSFQLLYNNIMLVSGALGSDIEGSGEGVTNSISSAIQALNDISLEEGIIAQFNNLKDAIDSVTSAISGGESSGGQSQGSQSGSSSSGSKSGGQGSEGGSSGSLTDAITQMGETANEVIGESGAEGDGTVIGEFGSLKTAVNDVTEAIGIGGEEGSGDGSQGEEDGTLIGSINDLGTTSEETLGESGGDGVIGRFEEFRDVIGEANKHVTGISEGLAAIDGQEVECTIKVNIETTGGLPAFAEGTLGNMNLESAEYNAKYGKAYATGYQGLPKAEKNALVSEYGQTEMTVFPNGETVITDSPTMMDLPKGTVIFNEDQTRKIMNGKPNVGTAHAQGTDGTITLSDGSTLRPLQPGDRMWDLINKAEEYMTRTGEDVHSLLSPVNVIQRDMEQMAKSISAVNNVSNNRTQSINIGDIQIICPGITDQEVANRVGIELDNKFRGLGLDAIQFSKIR